MVTRSSSALSSCVAGSEYLVSSPKNEDIVVALREIAAGKIIIKEGKEEEIKGEIEEVKEKEEDL